MFEFTHAGSWIYLGEGGIGFQSDSTRRTRRIAWIFPGEKKGGERRSRGLSSIFLLGRREKKGEKSWWRRWKRRRSLLLRNEREKNREARIYTNIYVRFSPLFIHCHRCSYRNCSPTMGNVLTAICIAITCMAKARGREKKRMNGTSVFILVISSFFATRAKFSRSFLLSTIDDGWKNCWPTIKICLAAEEIERGKRVILRRHVREPYEFSFVLLSSASELFLRQ